MSNESTLAPTLLSEVATALAKTDLLPAEHAVSYEILREKLTDTIRFLLNHDFERLISILYRIDVSEQALKNVLALPDPTTHASQIAELVIERQIRKAVFRKKYNST